MSNLTNYAENKIVDALYRGQALGAPATLYFEILLASKGDRANSTAYALNDTIALVANDTKVHLYKCTTAGTTAAAQGALYPGAANEVIADGTATFTEQASALDDATAFSAPSGGSYARASIAASLTNFAATQGGTTASTGSSGQTNNLAAVTWPAPTGNWTGTGKAWGIAMYDAASSGNPWVWAPLATTKSINNGDSAPSLAIGAHTFTLA